MSCLLLVLIYTSLIIYDIYFLLKSGIKILLPFSTSAAAHELIIDGGRLLPAPLSPPLKQSMLIIKSSSRKRA